jgi:hypothetical protein
MKNKSSLEKEQDYVDFLKKRLDSTNYKNNVNEEEYKDTKKKYDKAKFKLKMMKDKS